MSSRSSSATSLPVLTVESLDLAKNAPRRRPVHLKTTMRKESRPDREKGHVHTGPQSMTEAERKRYEGVWASNHRRNVHLVLFDEQNFLDNLVIRELWMRSNLPHELLGHIWYRL